MSENQLATIDNSTSQLSFSASGFDHIQRVARMFSESQLVPTIFQKNLPNVTIALEMSSRIGSSPLMIMQNMNVIHGKPSFSASFMIATVNACGRFTPLRFVYVGTEGQDDWGCYAVAVAKIDKAECKSVTITMAMAKAEGWVQKAGSKWKTMPQLMLSYRAATWWTRMFAPELLMGFPTQDEVIDVVTDTTTSEPTEAAAGTVEPVPVVTRRRAKGVSAMKVAEPVAETQAIPEVAATTAQPEAKPVSPAQDNSGSKATETAAEPARAPEKKQETAPAPEPTAPVDEGKPSDVPADENPANDMLPRCEIVKTTDKGNGVTEVVLKGDHTGTVYSRIAIPAAGTTIDIVFEDVPSKRDPNVSLKLIKSFEVIA